MVKFTKEHDKLLIESVKLNRILFDASDKYHKDYVLKHKRWEEISLVVGIPVSDCKKRWKSLRDQFNKKKKRESTGAEKTNSSWEYSSLMSFLLDTDERRETITNLDGQQAVVEVQIKDEERQHDQQNEEEQRKQQDEEELRYQQSEEQQPTDDEISEDDFVNTDKITVLQNKRRATKRNLSEPLMKMLVKRDAQWSALYEKIINKPLEHKTPMQKFFDSMADIADKLPPHLQAEIRLKVCQIVTDIEIKHHTQYTNAIGRFKLDDSNSP
ncbi:unnamed protein product [Euphydryas editha]|uniref:MADF domain-containing protein n=1 Tax=Euphydryas editha TaxID=104508 RepID=A0AAU9VC37_EUPED|nr:unnamed protein product [Euphydryas editha]